MPIAQPLWSTSEIPVRELPRPALFLAGRAFLKYRKAGGTKANVLADFFVGAHAAVLGCGILTRDARRYRRYFSTVNLLTPEGARTSESSCGR
jgi:predicted nucleic acid-binding protein